GGGGRCVCLRTRWWNWRSWTTSRTRRCGRRIKKNGLKPWLKRQYCLPGALSGEFVYHMEDVLDVYMRPYGPLRPQVCLDETSIQLVRESVSPCRWRLVGRLVSTTNMRGMESVLCSCSTNRFATGREWAQA